MPNILNPQIDSIIKKLLNVNPTRVKKDVELTELLTRPELFTLCDEATDVFLSEPPMLELHAPVKIVGDVHGQYEDLLCVFKTGGFPPESNYLFLGDYVDRGPLSIETVSLLLALKVKYRKTFFMLRGNHENSATNMHYGFRRECDNRYDRKVWRKFAECFNCMPVCALVEQKIFCSHGGLSPSLKNFNEAKAIRRPSKVPDDGLFCDLLWSDPCSRIVGWGKNSRGTSYIYGADVIQEKLRQLGIELVARAHQAIMKGYDFCAGRGIVTIFTAPNYVQEQPNAGSYMNVDENLHCNFIILEIRRNRKYNTDTTSMTV